MLNLRGDLDDKQAIEVETAVASVAQTPAWPVVMALLERYEAQVGLVALRQANEERPIAYFRGYQDAIEQLRADLTRFASSPTTKAQEKKKPLSPEDLRAVVGDVGGDFGL